MLDAMLRGSEVDAGLGGTRRREIVEEGARRGVLTYFSGYDIHWSPAGHPTAAIAIARFLERWQERDGWKLIHR
jgi:hypothetical protein